MENPFMEMIFDVFMLITNCRLILPHLELFGFINIILKVKNKSM